MGTRSQVNVSATGVLSVVDVTTVDETRVSAAGILSVGTKGAPDVDRTSVSAAGILSATTEGGLPPLSAFVSQIGHSWLEQAKTDTTSLKWEASHGYPHWTTGLSAGALEFPIASNFAASGKTSAEILSEQVPSAASAAESVVLISGPTNDQRSANNVASATTLANVQAMIDGLPGKTIVLTTVGAGGDANFPAEIISAGQLANRLAVNVGIRAMASSRVIIADVWAVTVDMGQTDGRAILGYLKDGIHPTQACFHLMVRDCLLPAIQSRIAARSVLPTGTAGWINSNPLLTGTTAATPGSSGGATITGNVPTGYALIGSGATGLTIACSVGTDGSDNYCECVVTGTPTAGNAFLRLYQNVAGSGLTTGDVLQTTGRVKYAAGQTGLRGVGIGFEARDTGTVIEERGGSTGTGNGDVPNAAIDIVIISPKMTLPSATYTGNNSRAYVRVDFTQNVPVNATFRLYRLGTKKVV